MYSGVKLNNDQIPPPPGRMTTPQAAPTKNCQILPDNRNQLLEQICNGNFKLKPTKLGPTNAKTNEPMGQLSDGSGKRNIPPEFMSETAAVQVENKHSQYQGDLLLGREKSDQRTIVHKAPIPKSNNFLDDLREAQAKFKSVSVSMVRETCSSGSIQPNHKPIISCKPRPPVGPKPTKRDDIVTPQEPKKIRNDVRTVTFADSSGSTLSNRPTNARPVKPIIPERQAGCYQSLPPRVTLIKPTLSNQVPTRPTSRFSEYQVERSKLHQGTASYVIKHPILPLPHSGNSDCLPPDITNLSGTTPDEQPEPHSKMKYPTTPIRTVNTENTDFINESSAAATAKLKPDCVPCEVHRSPLQRQNTIFYSTVSLKNRQRGDQQKESVEDARRKELACTSATPSGIVKEDRQKTLPVTLSEAIGQSRTDHYRNSMRSLSSETKCDHPTAGHAILGRLGLTESFSEIEHTIEVQLNEKVNKPSAKPKVTLQMIQPINAVGRTMQMGPESEV